MSLSPIWPCWNMVTNWILVFSCCCNGILPKSDLVLCCYCNRAVLAISCVSCTNARICMQLSARNRTFTIDPNYSILSSEFYCVLPSIGICSSVVAYYTAKLSHLADFQYGVITLSYQVISNVSYGYVIIQGSQFHIYRVGFFFCERLMDLFTFFALLCTSTYFSNMSIFDLWMWQDL